MSKPKFTPGPWVKDYGHTHGHVKSIAPHANGYTPTVCIYDSPAMALSISESEREANGFLIAAAPDYHEEAYALAVLVLQSDAYKDPEIRDAVDNVLLIHKRAEGVEP